MVGVYVGSKDPRQTGNNSLISPLKHEDVVERFCLEWGAPEDDLAMELQLIKVPEKFCVLR